MSFGDLERGVGGGGGSHRKQMPLPPHRPFTLDEDEENQLGDTSDSQFDKLAEKIKTLLFSISSNIAAIQRMVAQYGTAKDTLEMREKLTNLSHATQELVKQCTQDLKTLNSFRAATESRMKRLEQQKLSKDFQVLLARFQQIQRQSAEKSREYVAKAKQQSTQLDQEDEADAPLIQEESRRQQELIRLDHEIEYNEAVIADREQSIIEIEHAIHEVNEIFRDLGSLVNEQQGMIDNIESNIESSAGRTNEATVELQTAERYQKKARRRMYCLLMTFGVVLLILILVLVVKRST